MENFSSSVTEQSTKMETDNPLVASLKLSDFLVVEELGSGGFGHVDLMKFVDEGHARACKMPQLVAVKKVFMG